MKKNLKGFTLVELVIVIAIVIILSVVSVPIYRGYTRQAKYAEGYALLGTIFSAQKAYFSQYGYFLLGKHSSVGEERFTCNEEVLGIDARGNKYFTLFRVGYGNNGDNNRILRAFVEKPEELRGDSSKSVLALFYDITRGSTFKDNLESPGGYGW